MQPYGLIVWLTKCQLFGTTPFNMVYDLDAILLLEFLIPTLRVAKELNWTGHELLERLEDIEKLDKICLVAVHGMYALKRQHKKFHDSHISTKFKLGNLVLLFTLQQFVLKFTKQRRGPYAILRLSSSGTVKLLTLDGKEMSK